MLNKWGIAVFLTMAWIASYRAFCQEGGPVDTQGNLVGVVRDSASAPIADAFVYVYKMSGKNKGGTIAKLDSSGHFYMKLEPSTYDIFVSALGFYPACKEVRIVGKGAVTLRFGMIPSGKYKAMSAPRSHLPASPILVVLDRLTWAP